MEIVISLDFVIVAWVVNLVVPSISLLLQRSTSSSCLLRKSAPSIGCLTFATTKVHLYGLLMLRSSSIVLVP